MTTDVVLSAADPVAANGHGEAHSTAGFKALLLGSIGVVYGDIGTSPLYALRESVLAELGPNQPAGVSSRHRFVDHLGAVSGGHSEIRGRAARADNHGEGGTLALYGARHRVHRGHTAAIILLGIVSGALFYGDAMITPALSVLSAVEGLKVVAPDFRGLVVPLTVVILIGLFAVQSRGTARVAAFFGPITLCVVRCHRGVPVNLAYVQQSGSPAAPSIRFHGISFLARPWHDRTQHAWARCFSAVTGAEALYADLGHFGQAARSDRVARRSRCPRWCSTISVRARS